MKYHSMIVYGNFSTASQVHHKETNNKDDETNICCIFVNYDSNNQKQSNYKKTEIKNGSRNNSINTKSSSRNVTNATKTITHNNDNDRNYNNYNNDNNNII